MPHDAAFAGNFTTRYGKYLNPFAQVRSVRKYLRFDNATKIGDKFSYPLQAAISHGITPSNSGVISTLNPARSGVELTALLDSTALYGREVIPYDAVLRASNGTSKDGDAAAYWQPYDKAVFTLMAGLEFHNEIQLMHGCGGGSTIVDHIGEVATTPVLGGTGPNFGSVTHPIVAITRASWAPGLWNQAGSAGQTGSGMLVDILNSAGTALVETNVTVEGMVDQSLCQVQLFKSGSAVAVAAGQKIVPAGTFQTASFGLGGILKNTSTFAGISAASNPFWRGRSFNAAGALTAAKLGMALAKLSTVSTGRGGMSGFVHPLTFNELVQETEAKVRWTSDDGNISNVRRQGADTLEFISPVGPVVLVSHPYQKQGQAFFLEQESSVRVGASDITMRGVDGSESILLEIPDKNGSEIRGMSHQCALLTIPSNNLIITGISNTGDDIPA